MEIGQTAYLIIPFKEELNLWNYWEFVKCLCKS